MSAAEKHLLTLLEDLDAAEPDDSAELDETSLDALVDGAFDLLNDLHAPCPATAAALIDTEINTCQSGRN